MFSKNTLLALAAAAAVEASTPQGFNYGSTINGQPGTYDAFSAEFTKAQNLQGAPGTFNSARLYTMLDAADGTSVIPALKAAMDTKTSLLLGLWASGDPSGFTKEMNALKQAISSMPDLAQYVLGISVGSEDLYRISPTGLTAPNAAPGQEPDTLVDYIKQVRSALSGSNWSQVQVGHVDTWNAWVNGSNSEVIDNCDFLGVDSYPYYQNTEANGIENGKSLFDEAFDKTKGAAGGKPVWITETGWPVTGPTYGDATVGTQNAQTYWQDVGCSNFGSVPTFWYTLYDGVAPTTDPKGTPSFSVADANGKPLYDLSCSAVKNSTNSSSSSTAASSGFSTATASGSSSTATGSSGSGSSNGTYTGTPSQPTTSGTSGSGSSGSGSSTGAAASGSATTISTSGASSLSYSLTSMAAVAALAVAFL